MRGDETPKRSLLTRIRIPAGKAMALAAMPTAVLAGMNVPGIALAADKATPSAPAPCATRSAQPAVPATPQPKTSTGSVVDKLAPPGIGDKAKAAINPAETAIRDAAKKVGAKVDELSESVRSTVDKAKVETGIEPSACPPAGTGTLAASGPGGTPLLPDQPWFLDCSKLTLNGLDYEGVVQVRTAGGKTKKVLKFTASSIDIKDLHQKIVEDGRTTHLKARPGSVSTFRDGKVTMYTDELKGDLFGLVPITYTPDSPPPLNVSSVYFTDVKLKQAAQFGGTLTVPGLRSWVD